MNEADHPPVRRWSDLPTNEARLAKDGFEAWQAGRLEEAHDVLTRLREQAAASGTRDAMFHALHLLACVAFSRSDFDTSRTLHEQVLGLCSELAFKGGTASSLFDLAMIDQAEGNIALARGRFEEARVAFAEGGYLDRLPIVERALASLPADSPFARPAVMD